MKKRKDSIGNTQCAASMTKVTAWLTGAFVALKLTGYIPWSWLWVLSPVWLGGICFVVVAAALVFVFDM